MKKALLTLAAAALLALGSILPAGAIPPVGSEAPDFTLKSLDGKTTYTLSELRGQVVYLDFWASWCGPCRRSFPEVMSLYEEYKEKGFVVLAVSIDRTVEAAAGFMAKQKAPFPAVFDTKGAVATRYGVSSIPSAILVGPDGKIAHSAIGFDPRRVPELKKTIEGLLTDTAKPVEETKKASRVEADGKKI